MSRGGPGEGGLGPDAPGAEAHQGHEGHEAVPGTEDGGFVPRAGFVAPEVRAEFPGLRLVWAVGAAAGGSSPGEVRDRLRILSDRYRGSGVVAMRVRPVPHAFRAFFRQIGLDPDVQRIPSERAAVARLLHGEFRSAGLIGDACLVALLETGVPVWALDAGAVDAAGLGIRVATAADAEARGPAPPGSLVVADGTRAHAVLFDEPAGGSAAGRARSRVALFAVGVEGVPDIHLEEALWLAAGILRPR